eukprot:734034-Amphidinium_carterae.1
MCDIDVPVMWQSLRFNDECDVCFAQSCVAVKLSEIGRTLKRQQATAVKKLLGVEFPSKCEERSHQPIV